MVDTEGRRYLDAIASLWYCNIGHGRTELADAAAAQMRELAAYQTFEPFSNLPGPGAGPAGRGPGAGPRGQGLLHPGRRVRRRGHRGQARAGVLARGRPARQADHHRPVARLPRDERLRHHARRHPGQHRAVQPAGLAGRAHPVGRRGRPGQAHRAARRGEGRRVLVRAGHRGRGRVPAARGLPGPGARDLPPPRRAVRGRRGDHRVRPDRHLAGQRAVRARTRHDHHGQGPDLWLRPARRGDRGRAGVRAVLAARLAPRCSGTATPTPRTPPRARSAWPTSTCSSASSCSAG